MRDKATGIRRTNTGGWVAVVNGRAADTFTGPGSRRRAIQTAGTNREIPAATLSYPKGREPVHA